MVGIEAPGDMKGEGGFSDGRFLIFIILCEKKRLWLKFRDRDTNFTVTHLVQRLMFYHP